MDEVDFRYCEFRQTVDFSGCVFRQEFNSGDPLASLTIYHKDFICNGAVFEDTMSFSGDQVKGDTFFGGTRFISGEKPADFSRTSFEGTLVCNEATFRGPANFHALKCNGGFFRKAKFEGEQGVDFAHASFGVNLECQEATFRGPVRFSEVKCKATGLFHNARFESYETIDFRHASFDLNLELTGAQFMNKDEVKLQFISCSNPSLLNTSFTGPVNLATVRIAQDLALTTSTHPKARFLRKVVLRDATVGQLVMRRGNFPFKDGLNLHGFAFERFDSENHLAKQLVEAQDPAVFSRDPYLQLERYNSNIGDEVKAKRMHYQGRRDLRENAKVEIGGTEWPPLTKWRDWWIKWLTGYGVRTWLLLVPICFFLIFGTVMFWSDDSLKPRASSTSGTPSVTTETSTQSTETAVPATLPSEEQGPDSFEQKLVRRGGYSLDLFLPVVNLRIDERWEPQGLVRETYALTHPLAGWILVPLLIASFAGIIRRQ